MRAGLRSALTVAVLLAPFAVFASPGEAQTQYPQYTFLGAFRLDGTKVTDATAGETLLFKIHVSPGPNTVIVYHDLELRANGDPLGPTMYYISQGATTTVTPWQPLEVTIRWEQGRVLPSGTPAPGRYAVVYDDPSNSNIDASMVLDVDWQPNFLITRMAVSYTKLYTLAGRSAHNPLLLEVEGCVHNDGRESVTSIPVGLGFRTPLDPSTSPPRIVLTSNVIPAAGPTCVSKFPLPPTPGTWFKFSWLVPQDAARLSLLASQVALVADPDRVVAESSEIDNERTSPLPAVLS
ncbi:MAG TPA: hypothetical protein VM889_13865 [Candidatus Thermoplasmatota archaeon]|nr:hypothetical protein [Candidatus Thermoplasmatota archaeon]